MIPKFRVFVDEKIREVYAVKWNEDGCFVMVDYGGGLIKTFPADGVKLMQSTGLFDKNGKEIYEGDIIRMSLDGLRTFVCIYEKGGFQFQDLVHKTVCSNAGSYITHYIEIIGNVHENPELLNQ